MKLTFEIQGKTMNELIHGVIHVGKCLQRGEAKGVAKGYSYEVKH